MRYDEPVELSWREDVGDEFETAEVWAFIQDSGTASFDIGSGLSRADAYSCTMRFHSMPPLLRTLLQNVTVRLTLGDYALARCLIRGRDLLITSIVESDERRRRLRSRPRRGNPRMSLTSAVLGVVRVKVNGGLRQNVQRLIPTRTGALRRSVVIEVRQQHGGIALRVKLLGYFRYQEASGVDGKLIPAVGRLLFQVLRDSLIEGSRIHLLQTLKAWDLPLQSAFGRTVPGAIKINYDIFLLNNGRTR